MDRRVALIAPSASYVGPALARTLADRGHDLVLASPDGELVAELEAGGASVVAVPDSRDLAEPDTCERLVAAALDRFGRLDAACMFSGAILLGRFLDTTIDDLAHIGRGNLEAPYRFLQAVMKPMVDQRNGQVVVITSATAVRPAPGASLYSATRAAATMLVRNVAAEHARDGVQVNAVGTNFMDFPEFLRANGIADDPERRAKVEAMVPMGRLGTMEEFASFCSVLLDGTSRFQTGQFFSYSGGWSD
ncbi:MAG: SDR family NAD(P)-dependent oxidoreductase [Acidimicrobiales bacterium]